MSLLIVVVQFSLRHTAVKW